VLAEILEERRENIFGSAGQQAVLAMSRSSGGASRDLPATALLQGRNKTGLSWPKACDEVDPAARSGKRHPLDGQYMEHHEWRTQQLVKLAL
jgi:hypothetical protein